MSSGKSPAKRTKSIKSKSFDPTQPAPPPDIAHPKFEYTPALLQSLSGCDVSLGYLRGADIDAGWLAEQEQQAQILEAHHSTAIEGTQLTLEQAQRLLQGEDLPEVSADVRRELRNYWEALGRVSEYCAESRRISTQVIQQIHKDLVQGVRGGHARPGEWRQIRNAIANSVTGAVVFTPQPPESVPESMVELVDWTNLQLAGDLPTLHPVLVAGISQFWFLHIHPFIDGNGRTSRLLSTCILRASGNEFVNMFALSAHYDRDRPTYYAALQGVREQGLIMTGWLEYFAAGLETQLNELCERAAVDRALQQLVLKETITPRQFELMRLIRLEPRTHIRDLEVTYPSISRRTLQRDLARLEELGLLQSVGASHQQYWLVTDTQGREV